MSDWTPPVPLGEDGDAAHLLEMIYTRPKWFAKAKCRGIHANGGTNIFYSEDYGDHKAAKALCESCPVRRLCLERGAGDPFGMWGGQSQRARRRAA